MIDATEKKKVLGVMHRFAKLSYIATYFLFIFLLIDENRLTITEDLLEIGLILLTTTIVFDLIRRSYLYIFFDKGFWINKK